MWSASRENTALDLLLDLPGVTGRCGLGVHLEKFSFSIPIEELS